MTQLTKFQYNWIIDKAKVTDRIYLQITNLLFGRKTVATRVSQLFLVIQIWSEVKACWIIQSYDYLGY